MHAGCSYPSLSSLGTGRSPSAREEHQGRLWALPLLWKPSHPPFVAEKHAQGCFSSCCMSCTNFWCICYPVGACRRVTHEQIPSTA